MSSNSYQILTMLTEQKGALFEITPALSLLKVPLTEQDKIHCILLILKLSFYLFFSGSGLLAYTTWLPLGNSNSIYSSLTSIHKNFHFPNSNLLFYFITYFSHETDYSNLDVKCPPQFQVFEYMALSRWHCLESCEIFIEVVSASYLLSAISGFSPYFFAMMNCIISNYKPN